MPSLNEEKKGDISDTHAEHGEHDVVTSENIHELSNIEDTVATKATWLSSMFVSLEGFLFSTHDTILRQS